jgi:membrane protein
MIKLERLQTRLEKLYARLDRRLGGVPSLLVRTGLAFGEHDGALMARSIAYYAVFAVFPAILALIVLAGAVLQSEEVQQSVMSLVEQYMPIAADAVAANIEELLAMSGTIGLVALVGLIWSASGVASAIFRSVNRAWGVPKSKLLLSAKLYGLAMMCIVGLFLLVAVAIGPILSLVQAWQAAVLELQPSAEPVTDLLVGLLSALVPPLLSVSAFILMYRTMPRTRVRWRDVWLGGLIAGLIWSVGQEIFVWYVANYADYEIYGSVSAIIVFMLWAYLSGQILLLGAEFTAEYGRWRHAGRPVETRPLHEWMDGWTPSQEIEEGEESGTGQAAPEKTEIVRTEEVPDE